MTRHLIHRKFTSSTQDVPYPLVNSHRPCQIGVGRLVSTKNGLCSFIFMVYLNLPEGQRIHSIFARVASRQPMQPRNSRSDVLVVLALKNVMLCGKKKETKEINLVVGLLISPHINTHCNDTWCPKIASSSVFLRFHPLVNCVACIAGIQRRSHCYGWQCFPPMLTRESNLKCNGPVQKKKQLYFLQEKGRCSFVALIRSMHPASFMHKCSMISTT